MERLKNVFTIDPKLPFLETLAAELWRQTESDGFKLSRCMILLPTRRACRALGSAFSKLANGRPVLLPRMRPLGDIDEEEMSFADEDNFDVPPALPPMKRLMLLTKLVKQRDTTQTWDQAALSADALARFLDQIQIEQCDLNDLPRLVEEQNLAVHWQQTLQFLEIVTRHWPKILEEQGGLDPAIRRNRIMATQANLWKNTPPPFPIVAAGSTGSIPATAELLDAIASLPLGAIVLPGLDRSLNNEAWDELDETHPQHSMKNLLNKMGVDRAGVKDFARPVPAEQRTCPPSRLKLLSEAMRPASLTDTWRSLRDQLDPIATQGLTRLILDHPQEEAQVIALRLRDVLETPGKTAALVTADRDLATRVASLLQRWGIKIDDSGVGVLRDWSA